MGVMSMVYFLSSLTYYDIYKERPSTRLRRLIDTRIPGKSFMTACNFPHPAALMCKHCQVFKCLQAGW